ncbi:MAG: response regulator [Deltaproteobacteria bacterium]|nr:response regulator [Deltaproteobacteria bacterium]
MINGMFSIPQAAKYCAVSRGTLWKYVKTGDLKASLTPGGHYRILKKDLKAFILEKGMYPLAHNRSSNIKILIVDDDPAIQKMLNQILCAHQYETETASDGFEAGAKTTAFKPGLIILDLVMPGMDGFEVCGQIKKNPDTSHIKILAVTGHNTKENKEKIINAGADGYLVKPVVKDTLLQKIEELLNYKQNFKNHQKR